jgi:hypothetical protein
MNQFKLLLLVILEKESQTMAVDWKESTRNTKCIRNKLRKSTVIGEFGISLGNVSLLFVLDVDVMMKEGKVKKGISVQRLWD